MSSMPTAECPQPTTTPPAPGAIRAWASGGDVVFAFTLPRLSGPIAGLSSAESEVVRGAILGLSNAAIARARATSTRTVANQLASVYAKLRVSGRAELLARLAASSGADGSREGACRAPGAVAGISIAEATELDGATARSSWHALLIGRLVVHAITDADGTRYVVARPSAGRPPTWARAPMVAHLAAQGLSNKQIALELGLAASAVSRTVTALIRRLGLRSRFDLAALVAEP